ncbi:23 kDa nuclear protein [Gallid alphaherpesvirus 2]|uniref:23-kDa nuclear protein n=1 Tax=Gallid alphaherpesvirus 2 TaxID=10390 RepID=Q15A27_9ALPH|nr:23-kDa nuclear protein [Gallid alphaherpesvirus 2]ABG22796.1 23-kDa nuclear protein [Gallid alphaherpesvirus 2]AFM74538.1 alpha-enolase binding protein [Gallid alphaherpesvirus 2]AFM74662.1 23 kDa nuclear protein [Gallid alphaherpesvirus 2]AFM74726.1 alpha-enolase binding protein [Gallid alphaherpesvirus 2]
MWGRWGKKGSLANRTRLSVNRPRRWRGTRLGNRTQCREDALRRWRLGRAEEGMGSTDGRWWGRAELGAKLLRIGRSGGTDRRLEGGRPRSVDNMGSRDGRWWGRAELGAKLLRIGRSGGTDRRLGTGAMWSVRFIR